jgi:hypothetical protein
MRQLVYQHAPMTYANNTLSSPSSQGIIYVCYCEMILKRCQNKRPGTPCKAPGLLPGRCRCPVTPPSHHSQILGDTGHQDQPGFEPGSSRDPPVAPPLDQECYYWLMCWTFGQLYVPIIQGHGYAKGPGITLWRMLLCFQASP